VSTTTLRQDREPPKNLLGRVSRHQTAWAYRRAGRLGAAIGAIVGGLARPRKPA